MRKRNKKIIAIDALRSKSMFRLIAARSHCLLKKASGLHSGNITYGKNLTGWYQHRKRAEQRLRNLSNGKLVFFENGYRGHHVRHRMKNLQCGHVFVASLHEVRLYGSQNICPFCNLPEDMSRFGSIEAIQEYTLFQSHSNVYFLGDNDISEVSKSSDVFKFHCLIHDIVYLASMVQFTTKAGQSNGCPCCEGQDWWL